MFGAPEVTIVWLARISSQIYAKLRISNLVSPGLLIAWAPERLMKILKNCTAIISPAVAERMASGSFAFCAGN